MSYFMGICSTLFILLSLGTCTMAKGAPHEIEGLIMLLIGVVLFVGAAIIETLDRPVRQRAKDLREGKLMICGACKGVIAAAAVRCEHCSAELIRESA